jgi:parallel beta-helix repeat protein
MSGASKKGGEVLLCVLILILPCVSVLGQTYVDGISGSDAFDGSSPTPGIPPIGPKATINAGISVTTPTFTLYIASATYNENVLLNASISLEGDSATSVIFQSAVGDTIYITAPDVQISTMTICHSAGGNSVSVGGVSGTFISNCAFTGPHVAVDLGLSDGSDTTTINTCTFNGCQAVRGGWLNNLSLITCVSDNSTSHDISLVSSTDISVLNSQFTNAALSSIFLEQCDTVLLQGNTILSACSNITSPTAVGTEFGAITYIGDRTTSYAINSGLTIRDNTIKDTIANSALFESFVPGCTYRSGAIGFDMLPDNCQILNNTFQNNADGGIQVNLRLPGVTSFVCRNNNFTGNGGMNFEINPAYNNLPLIDNFVLGDLSFNWWGVSGGPLNIPNNPSGSGGEVKRGQAGDELDFSPWLGSPTGFSPQSYYVIKLTDVADSKTTIGEAVDISATTDTVFVEPGTYHEGLDITKSLTLKSVEDASNTIIDGLGTGRPFTSGQDIPLAIKPSSDDTILIDGLKFINSYIGVEMKDTGAHSGDNLTVMNCLFENNDVNGVAIVVEHSRAVIDNNIIHGPGAGLRIANSSDCEIRNNTITGGSNYGIAVGSDNLEGLGALTCENIAIQSNIIGNLTSTIGTQSFGVFLGWSDGSGATPLCKNVTLADNTITTCGHTGVLLDGLNAPGDGSLLITGNKVHDCGTSIGVSADGIWALGTYGDIYGAILKNNEVANNGDIGIRIDTGYFKVEQNIITNNGVGILVNGGTVDLGGGSLGAGGYNHIENNATLNLHNVSPMDMKAKFNFWGSIDYNTVELTIDHKPDNPAEGLVDFAPLKGVSEPDTVWVSRTYTTLTPGFGYDHFDNIQDGTAAVALFGHVNVADGVYDAELSYPVNIPKCETISGESTTGTIIRSPSSFVDTAAQTGTTLIRVYGSSVAIANMTIDGDNNPAVADDETIPERGHGDSEPANDVNALAGILFNPPGATQTFDRLTLRNILFKNLYIGAWIAGRPGAPDEISMGNLVENCEFLNIGARDKIIKSGAGIYVTSAQAEVSNNTFTLCDIGINGVLDPSSDAVSLLSAHDNTFMDNYFGILLDGSKCPSQNAGLATFDPDGFGPILEGIDNNIFDATESFIDDTDGWKPDGGDFIDHFNLDCPTSGTFADPTPPTRVPDTPVGIAIIGGTDPIFVTWNLIINMRRSAIVMSERGAAGDDGIVTFLTNWFIGPSASPSFDSTGILGRNRRIYGDAAAEDDFGGDVKFRVYYSYIDGGVDLIRLQEEPAPLLYPTTFFVTIGGSIANRNVFGLARRQAINLGHFDLTGGGMRDDVNATYNDFLVNRYYEIENVVYHKNDDPTLGSVLFQPAKRISNNVSLVADPSSVDQYNVTVNLTASVTDVFGLPVADSIPVIFSSDFGALGTTNPVMTIGGNALNTLMSNFDGVANLTAVADGCASGTASVSFNVTNLTTTNFYPFNNADSEGWTVGAPPPGTYVSVKDGSFYMAPAIQSTGQIGINGKFTVSLFGYWSLKDSSAIHYVPNKVYRARYRLRTDQSNHFKSPMARLRWTNVIFMTGCTQIVDKGLNSVGDTWSDFYSYYLPPDVTGAAETDRNLTLNFDLIDFTREQYGALYLDEIEVETFNLPPRSIATPVIAYDAPSGFSDWVGLNIPNIFGKATYGSDATGLYLESGATPAPPAGKAGLPDYGSWEIPLTAVTPLYVPNKLYRAIFTLQIPNAATRETIARIRLRMENAGFDWCNVYELFQRGPGAYNGHLPSATGMEYSMFMESPRAFYSGADEFKNKMLFAFDLVDGKDSEYGRVYLKKVDVEYYDIP